MKCKHEDSICSSLDIFLFVPQTHPLSTHPILSIWFTYKDKSSLQRPFLATRHCVWLQSEKLGRSFRMVTSCTDQSAQKRSLRASVASLMPNPLQENFASCLQSSSIAVSVQIVASSTPRTPPRLVLSTTPYLLIRIQHPRRTGMIGPVICITERSIVV